METIGYDNRRVWRDTHLNRKRVGTIDKTFQLELNDSKQRIRICAHNAAAPPVLVVQGGPGYPMLHEVKKFQRKLALEQCLAVCYWDQRGCGPAAKKDLESVSFRQQVKDLEALIRWIRANSGQKVTLLGISIGATAALLAAEHEHENINAVVAISPDINIAEMDASAAEFLARKASTMPRRFTSDLTKLGDPPYIDPAKLQLRARLLANSDAIEHGRSFSSLAAELLVGLIRTYGPIGAVSSLRNMNAVQRRMLPELLELNALTELPVMNIPVHCVVGGNDPLVSTTHRKRISSLPGYSLTDLPDAGHMTHFDRPDVVSSIVIRAAGVEPDRHQVQ
ncbi:MAG: alpha/beta hydrolase [Acidobacteriota bacterium]